MHDDGDGTGRGRGVGGGGWREEGGGCGEGDRRRGLGRLLTAVLYGVKLYMHWWLDAGLEEEGGL